MSVSVGDRVQVCAGRLYRVGISFPQVVWRADGEEFKVVNTRYQGTQAHLGFFKENGEVIWLASGALKVVEEPVA